MRVCSRRTTIGIVTLFRRACVKPFNVRTCTVSISNSFSLQRETPLRLPRTCVDLESPKETIQPCIILLYTFQVTRLINFPFIHSIVPRCRYLHRRFFTRKFMCFFIFLFFFGGRIFSSPTKLFRVHFSHLLWRRCHAQFCRRRKSKNTWKIWEVIANLT